MPRLPPTYSTPTDGQVITVGDVTGVGDALMINDAAERQLDIANCRRPCPLDSLVAAAPADHHFPTHVRNRSNEPKLDDDTGFLFWKRQRQHSSSRP